MSNQIFARVKHSIVVLCAGGIAFTGCASRMALRDEVNQPITENEVKAKKSSKNLLLYSLGGGALSFGASFFAGSMVDRGLDSDSRTALWVITGAGTLAGTAVFAHTGSVRDFNQAVEAVKDDRKELVDQQILGEKKKQENLTTQRKKLEDERKRQEMEREKLLQQIREKQSQEPER